jgi:hypothetical protein
LTNLFPDFRAIAGRFSLRQIDRAIWAIWCGPFSLDQLLWDNTVALDKRVECIRSMYLVYAEVVAKSDVRVMENCFDMWWDWLPSNFWGCQAFDNKIQEGDTSKLDSDSKTLLDEMFLVLRKILELPDRRVQCYALHGLGHVHHPDVRALVQAFIDANRKEYDEVTLKWLEQCRDGTVM